MNADRIAVVNAGSYEEAMAAYERGDYAIASSCDRLPSRAMPTPRTNSATWYEWGEGAPRGRADVQSQRRNSAAGLWCKSAARRELPMTLPSFSISRLVAGVLLLLCVVAGYLLAEWWSGGRDTTRLAKICGRFDYISGFQQEFGGDAAEEMREQLTALVEECRTALRNCAQETD